MFQLLMLLAFAYAQDNYGSYPAHLWAMVYGMLNMLMMVMFGATMIATLVLGVILTIYAWVYFMILRRVRDNVLLWIIICLGGLLVPPLLAV